MSLLRLVLGFILLTPLLSAVPQGWAQDQESLHILSRFIGVDLRDMAALAPGRVPDAEAMLNHLEHNPQAYVSRRRFSRQGVSYEQRRNQIYGVEIAELPHGAVGGGVTYRLHLTEGNGIAHLKLRKYDVTLRLEEGQPVVHDVSLVSTHDLADETLHIEASLSEQLLVVRGASTGLVKVYPMAVGMLDEGVTEGSAGRTVVVTPTYRGASLRRGGLYEEVARGGLFRNRPFMHIVNARGRVQNIGFHANTASGTPVTMIYRGYASSGCMRLREKDLYELYSLLTTSTQGRIEVDVVDRLPPGASDFYHPYPHWDVYKRVLNVGTADDPRERRSVPEGGFRPLREAEVVPGPVPPHSALHFVNGDDPTPEEHEAYCTAPGGLLLSDDMSSDVFITPVATGVAK
jgi:hypothetical protein